MKKYNTPHALAVSIAVADIITTSPATLSEGSATDEMVLSFSDFTFGS